MTRLISLLFAILILSTQLFTLAFAETATQEKSAKSAEPVSEDHFRCERLRLTTIAALKAKLVENCDLSKPFSFSTSNNLGLDATATYCCTTKN